MRFSFSLGIALTVGVLVIIGNDRASAQSTKQQKDSVRTAHINDLVRGQNFEFKAEMATSANGNLRHVETEGYDVIVSKDSLIVYLPYFGRAFVAPANPTQGGIQFTSVQFDYLSTPRKKGGWDITLKPRDGQDVMQMFLTVYTNGSSNLQVTPLNRQSMSFSGHIASRKGM